MTAVFGFQLLKSPMIETRLGVRRPDCELHAALAIFLGEVSAEFFVGAVMSAFREQVEVEFAYRRLQLRTPWCLFVIRS